ncbi:MAG TPA: hypothetical protein VLS48_02985, partial [Anaerolineales bacterium]|nr:hypothetical protein [Anaerolineales bacterium]
MPSRTPTPLKFPLAALLQKTWSRLYKAKPGELPLTPESSPDESLGTAVERYPDDPFWDDLLHAKGVVDLTR